jgi:outer membrane protein
MAKKICLLLVAFLSLVPARSNAQDTLFVSLSSAVARSLEISPEVRAKAAKADYAEARYNLARASRFLTEFNATSAHSTAPALDNPNNAAAKELYLDPDVRNDWEDLSMFNRIEFSAVQPIWTWGELGKSIDAAMAGLQVEEAAVMETTNEVALRSAQLYFSLQLTEALARLTTEAGDIVEQAKKEIDRLIEEGDEGVDDADLFQVQITEQEFLQRVVEVEEGRKTARAALSRQLFLPDAQSVAVESTLLNPVVFDLESLESYQAVALAQRPELARASAGLEARNALVDVAKSNYYPKLFLGLSGRWSYAAGRERQPNPYISDPFLSRSLQVGFGLRQNLNFAQTKAKVSQAEAEASEVRFQGDAARQLVLFEVEEAYRNVIIAQAAVTSREEALQISKDWLRMEQVNFDLDIGDTENLVKAVRDNLSLRAARQDAVYKYNIAVIRLLGKTGTLIPTLEAGTLVGL